MSDRTVRGISFTLAIGLALLWIAGISSEPTTMWLAWLNFVAALAGFILSARSAPSTPFPAKRPDAWPSAMGLGLALVILWIIGLGAQAVPWLNWWTLAFGAAYILTGIAGSGGERKRVEGAGEPPVPLRKTG